MGVDNQDDDREKRGQKGRFPKGKSGNPRGRPRKTNMSVPSGNKGSEASRYRDEMQAFFKERIKIEKNGVATEVSRLNVLLHGFFKNTINGNVSAARLIATFMKEVEGHERETAALGIQDEDYGRSVREKLEQMYHRIRTEAGVPPDYTGSVDCWRLEQKLKEHGIKFDE